MVKNLFELNVVLFNRVSLRAQTQCFVFFLICIKYIHIGMAPKLDKNYI